MQNAKSKLFSYCLLKTAIHLHIYIYIIISCQELAGDVSLLSPLSPVSGASSKIVRSKGSGSGGKESGPGGEERGEQFTGISCLLITWKSNPEVEQFKVKQRQPRKTAAR